MLGGVDEPMRLSLKKAAHGAMGWGRAVGNPGSFALLRRVGFRGAVLKTSDLNSSFKGEKLRFEG